MHGFPTQESLILQPATTGGDMTDMDRAHMLLDFTYDLHREFEDRDNLFRQIDDVIFLQQAVKIPENFKQSAIEIRSPLPTHIANNITAAMTINVPTVEFDKIEFGDSGEDHAAYRRAFFQSSWQKQQRDKKRRLFRLGMWSVVTKGIGIWRTQECRRRSWARYEKQAGDLKKDLTQQLNSGVIDQDSYDRVYNGKTEDYKKGAPYPIETMDIPPETFYYQMGEDGFVRCIEIKSVPYYETLRRYNAGLDSKGRVVSSDPKTAFDNQTSLPMPDTQWHKVWHPNEARYIQMVEIWDCENQYIIIRGPGDIPNKRAGFVGSGLLVKTTPHNYANPGTGTLRGPYFMASGITTAHRGHKYSNLSVLFAYIHLFPMLNALLTMQTQAAFTFAYPAYRRTQAPNFGLEDMPFGYDAKELQENRRQVVPGAIFPHDIAPMDQPRTTVDLDRSIQFVRGLIERALPDTVQGVITGETAGYAINQASHLASLAWSPIVENVEETLSDRTGFESLLIEGNIGETVYVPGALPRPASRSGYSYSGSIDYKQGYIGIGPKQLKGVHEYRVKLKPASVNNDALILRNIQTELDMRIMAPDEAIRMRGRNPVDVDRAWNLHMLKQDPAIMEILKQRTFRELNTIDQQALQGVPEGADPNAQPPTPLSGAPAGAAPGISEGLPATGFVPPQGAVPNAQPPAPEPNALPRPTGVPTGAPGGIRGVPANASPLPGGG